MYMFKDLLKETFFDEMHVSELYNYYLKIDIYY